MATFVELSPELCVVAVVAVLIVPFISPEKVVAVAVPLKVGSFSGAFKSNAVCVAVETGFFASLVLFTFVKPTIVLSIPDTVPVKVGSAKGAFRAKPGTVGAVAVPARSPANCIFPAAVALASATPEAAIAST